MGKVLRERYSALVLNYIGCVAILSALPAAIFRPCGANAPTSVTFS